MKHIPVNILTKVASSDVEALECQKMGSTFANMQ